MLSESELETLLTAAGVTESGRLYVQRVRSSPPSRTVASGARNVACRFASRKMGRTIQAESHTGELPALWIWEFSSDTHEFWDQPEPIAVPMTRRDGRQTNQAKTADFLLLQHDFVGWVECKPRAWLENELKKGNANFLLDEHGSWHYLPGERAAKEFGMGYVVRLAEDNNPVLVDNLSFLDDFLTEGSPQVSEDLKQRIVALVAGQGWMLLSELVRDQGVEADAVYALIARRELHVRLDSDRLRETTRTFVYKDADAVETHTAFLRSGARMNLPDVSCVDLTPGANVCWDGRVFKVLNDGATGFFLETPERTAINLPKETMYRLIGEGAILADPSAPDSRSQRAAERLRVASEAQMSRATKRFQALFPSENAGPSKTPVRTLSLWRQLYRKGVEVYGNGFVGLLPDIHKRGNRLPKLPALSRQILVEVIQTQFMTADAKCTKVVWGIVRNRCKDAGTMPPSEATVRREIARLFTSVEIARARQGDKVAYQIEPQYWWLFADTPRHGQRPFEVAHLDHTQADVQLVDTRFGRKVRRCWISALIDAYTREVLATYVTFDAPSYRSCMMVVRECVRRHGRVPDTIIVDWGGDFRSSYFERLLAYLNVQKKHRPKSSPRHGTLVERLFKRLNEDLLHQLQGNNKALQRPRSMSASHDPRSRAVWTLEAFWQLVQNYVDQVYAVQVNETLGVSPRQAMQAGMRDFGERAHRRIAYDEAFRMICLPSTPAGVARVRPGALIRINGIGYHAAELLEPGLEGAYVEVRYDPFNVGKAYAFLRNVWTELTSEYSEVFSRYTEREIQGASEELRERRGQTYRNRAISAEILARFLLEAEVQAARLLEGQDKASPAAAPSLVATPAGAADQGVTAGAAPFKPETPILSLAEGFAGLEIEEYGDIE